MHRRVKSQGGGIFTRTLNRFQGIHTGYARTDEPAPFARMVKDLDVREDELYLRAGKGCLQSASSSANNLIINELLLEAVLAVY